VIVERFLNINGFGLDCQWRCVEKCIYERHYFYSAGEIVHSILRWSAINLLGTYKLQFLQ